MNHALPGEDLIEAGLIDLREGRESIAALLVAIGSPRLRRLGLDLPADLPSNPEHRLYHLLAKDESDSAHSRYNACLRHLIIFEHSASMRSVLCHQIPDSEISLIRLSALLQARRKRD